MFEAVFVVPEPFTVAYGMSSLNDSLVIDIGGGTIGLLAGTFAFFWLHSALWFYREYKDRKQGKNRPHIKIEDLPVGSRTHFKRFPKWWRVAHLIGAVSIMTLVLTGVGVLYAQSAWAPGLMALLGGPQVASYVHRIAAIGFMGVFFVHLIYFAIKIGEDFITDD